MPTITITLPKPHKNQRKILENRKRFNLVKCGRRFGKTELVKILCAIALDGQYVGVWFPTYKDLSEVWNELLATFYDAIKKKDEQLKQIQFHGGGKIDFWSMEEPDSGRGRRYHRAIVDEAAKAKKFKQAWTATIRPTLTDFQGDAWFFSTPKGKNNYFFLLERDMRSQSNWSFHKFTSYDNPFLAKEEIEAAKSQLDDLTFRQEYMADDVDANDRPFMYAFEESVHVIKRYVPNPNLPLFISFDFNKDPMTCTVGQSLNIRHLCIFDQVKIDNGSTPELCDILLAKYKDWIGRIFITGDASGKNRTPLVRGGLNHYMLIKRLLMVKDVYFRVRNANLSHINSRILCNSVLQNAEFRVVESCRDVIQDITYGAVDEDGTIIKSEDQGMHFLDNVRYMIDAHFHDFITKPLKYGKPR